MTTSAASAWLPPLALTMGEPAGIGGEIALKAWVGRSADSHPFFIVDDPDRLRRLARDLGFAVPVAEIAAAGAARQVFANALPVLALSMPVDACPGTVSLKTAAAVMSSIERAVGLAAAGEAAAVVTNPIHKLALYDAGFAFPGHTEFLADLAGIDHAPVMLLVSPALRVVPVTIHVSLRDAIQGLRSEAIVHAGQVTAASLVRDFGIAKPRLAVAGLNPHAGEAGALGDEERTIIAPAVAALGEAGIAVCGPLPPDTLFTAASRSGFDAAICMYHDQALIPLKALDFDHGVNVTLGLPFVRTSPDHGTALDLAGTGRASEASLVAALALATAMARRRLKAA